MPGIRSSGGPRMRGAMAETTLPDRAPPGRVGLPAVLYAEFSRLTIKYTVTDSRIIRKDGIIRRRTNQMPFNKIERVELDQGLIQRMLNLGDIVLDTGEDTIVLQSLGN